MKSVEQEFESTQLESSGSASCPEPFHVKSQTEEIDFEGAAILHIDMLYSYAVWTTGSPDMARDLVRDTYRRAVRHWCTGEGRRDIRAWMFQLLRSQMTENPLVHGETQSTDGETEDLGSLARRRQRGDQSLSKMIEVLPENKIARAVRSLSEPYRTLIILCDIQGLTYSEIAELVECTVDEVRAQIRRARQLLRAVLLD